MHYRVSLIVISVLIASALGGSIFAQAQKPWAPPKSGVWQVKGSDTENTAWTAELILTRRGSNKGQPRYKGYFEWKSEDGETSGREYFNGWFERKTGRLMLKAYSAKSEKGDIGVGNYLALGREKGTRLVGGRWWGHDVVPGTWTADWSGPK